MRDYQLPPVPLTAHLVHDAGAPSQQAQQPRTAIHDWPSSPTTLSLPSSSLPSPTTPQGQQEGTTIKPTPTAYVVHPASLARPLPLVPLPARPSAAAAAPWSPSESSAEAGPSTSTSSSSFGSLLDSPSASSSGSISTLASSVDVAPSPWDSQLLDSPPPTPPPRRRRSTRSAQSSSTFNTQGKELPSQVPLHPHHQQQEEWSPDDFTLKLLFTSPSRSSGGAQAPAAEDDDHSLPPAVFPSARISFAPRLRITASQGLPYSTLGGLHLGVTGMCEMLDDKGRIKSKRLVADWCTDLTSGLRIWKRDAEASGAAKQMDDGEARLPPGTYVLPLSMKIPNSERLPPSFECSRFRIHYIISIALFSAALSTAGTPRRLKVFSIPFHVLPTTLPTPPPELPILQHDQKKSIFSSLVKSFSGRGKEEKGFHIVYPTLPTSHFSPASMACIPVSLRIVDRPIEPTDLYIRLALVRRSYVRESSSCSIAAAIEDEWGLGLGLSPSQLGHSEEMLLDPWCKEEEEVVSRWGWIPYSGRPGADPMEKAEVIIRDITMPLFGPPAQDGGQGAGGWRHGYSVSLDLEPTELPSLAHGDCSWFSPAFRSRPPSAQEYSKHVHVSTRFFVTVEVGFATPELGAVLQELKAANPEMEVPLSNAFTRPQFPAQGKVTNPFQAAGEQRPKLKTYSNSSPLLANGQAPTFPGKLRELVIPVTIGSVAEPSLDCIAAATESNSRRSERREREERGEDLRAEGEGPEGAWLCAPPMYKEAILHAPAYVFGA